MTKYTDLFEARILPFYQTLITMNRNVRIYILKINLILFALLYSLITLNKSILRPNLNHIPFFKWFLGCLPNFLASFFITMTITVAVLYRKPKYARGIVYLAGIILFFIFMLEEYIPFWGVSETFDPYDILASGLGVVLAFLFYEIIRRKYKNKIT